MRVKVRSGDGKTSLGEGNYVGDVTVYFFFAPDHSLLSIKDCETYPDSGLLEEMESVGTELCSTPDNPKIILDSGETVYGCQVWWERISDEQD